MNLAGSLHSPHVIPLGKTIWMIILFSWMMLIPRSPNLGAVMGRKQVIRHVRCLINLKMHKLVL